MYVHTLAMRRELFVLHKRRVLKGKFPRNHDNNAGVTLSVMRNRACQSTQVSCWKQNRSQYEKRVLNGNGRLVSAEKSWWASSFLLVFFCWALCVFVPVMVLEPRWWQDDGREEGGRKRGGRRGEILRTFSDKVRL